MLEPTQQSVQLAIVERGLQFGNNGDDASHMTADIGGSENPFAWPLVGYTYLVMRKRTLRQGASCAHVQATMEFWHWFWHSTVPPHPQSLLNNSASARGGGGAGGV